MEKETTLERCKGCFCTKRRAAWSASAPTPRSRRSARSRRASREYCYFPLEFCPQERVRRTRAQRLRGRDCEFSRCIRSAVLWECFKNTYRSSESAPETTRVSECFKKKNQKRRTILAGLHEASLIAFPSASLFCILCGQVLETNKARLQISPQREVRDLPFVSDKVSRPNQLRFGLWTLPSTDEARWSRGSSQHSPSASPRHSSQPLSHTNAILNRKLSLDLASGHAHRPPPTDRVFLFQGPPWLSRISLESLSNLSRISLSLSIERDSQAAWCCGATSTPRSRTRSATFPLGVISANSSPIATIDGFLNSHGPHESIGVE